SQRRGAPRALPSLPTRRSSDLAYTDPLGHTTTFAYNASGDLTGYTAPLTRRATLAWSAGLLQTSADPLGRAASYAYVVTRPSGRSEEHTSELPPPTPLLSLLLR